MLEAAALARVTVQDVHVQVGADGVHFLETPDGLLLCVNSLSQTEQFGGLRKLV